MTKKKDPKDLKTRGAKKKPLDLPKGWQIEVLALYRKGGSDSEVKVIIYDMRGSFSNDLWDRWLNEEPEFTETIRVGRMLSKGWWLRAGRENVAYREFNYQGWYMNMRNRFGWADKQEHDINGSLGINWHEEKTYEK